MSMYTTPIEQIADGNGKPIVGAKKFLFSVGTIVKKTIYSDPELTVARANPVLSDADGRFPQFYLSGLYDEIQQDNSGTATGYDGVTLWGPEQVGELAEGPLELWATDQTYNIPDIVVGSNDEYYKTLIDSNQGNDPVSSPGSWEQLQFGRVWNTNVTYAVGEAVYGSDGYSYISVVAANVGNNPVSSPTQWRPNANVMQSAIVAGTADAITAVFPIPFTALNDQTIVSVRALLANATTTPTFAPDGLTAKTIVKNGNQALLAGDINASHELILKYNSINDNWELLNPFIMPGLTSTIAELNYADDPNTASKFLQLDANALVPFAQMLVDDFSGSVASVTATSWSARQQLTLTNITTVWGISIVTGTDLVFSAVADWLVVTDDSYYETGQGTAPPTISAPTSGDIDLYLYNPDASAATLSYRIFVWGK